MTARILYGKEFAAKIKESARLEVEDIKNKFGVTAGLAVIIVGENPASQVYVRNKHKTCEELGIKSEVITMPETSTKEELLAKIDELNAAKDIHGILVQLPLPDAIKAHSEEILNRIDPLKDVDGFHPMNVGKLVTGSPALVPCTPAGCLEMLDLAGIDIDGKRAVIIGRSNIVGKPMLHLLMARHATVTVCHSKTKNLASYTKNADILIVCIGKANYITGDMVKDKAIVIDVGTNLVDGRLCGDVLFNSVKDKASYITPVPGGVGQVTTAVLFENIYNCYVNKKI